MNIGNGWRKKKEVKRKNEENNVCICEQKNIEEKKWKWMVAIGENSKEYKHVSFSVYFSALVARLPISSVFDIFIYISKHKKMCIKNK